MFVLCYIPTCIRDNIYNIYLLAAAAAAATQCILSVTVTVGAHSAPTALLSLTFPARRGRGQAAGKAKVNSVQIAEELENTSVANIAGLPMSNYWSLVRIFTYSGVLR